MATSQRGSAGRSKSARRTLSKRFLGVEEVFSGAVQQQRCRAWGPAEVFAEGQWQSIRVQLEGQGWNPSQIEMVHDQLRQGWPLATAKLHAARLSGHCPIRDQPGS